MTVPDPVLQVNLNPANPGQFFACCGLFELADRLWPDAVGWFDSDKFCLSTTETSASLAKLMERIRDAKLVQLDPEDDTTSAIQITSPFNICLDWWQDHRSHGKELKVWAGSMGNYRIAQAMKHAFTAQESIAQNFLFDATVAFEPGNPKKKVEPFYFDAQRGANAHALDIGFAPDKLGSGKRAVTVLSFPACEFLAFVGLQRFRPFRPSPVEKPRIFDYWLWKIPLSVLVAQGVTCGLIQQADVDRYRFENAYRSNQRKHQSFLPAQPVT